MAHHQQVKPDKLKKLRQRLDMTQREFAETFGFSYETLRHWEVGNREPHGPAKALLQIIDKEPEAAIRALKKTKAR